MSSTIDINKICEWCGKEFIAHKCSTRYCSKRCSEHAYKSLRREAHVKKENLITQEKKEDKKKPLEITLPLGNAPFYLGLESPLSIAVLQKD